MKILIILTLLMNTSLVIAKNNTNLTFAQLKDSCINFSRYGYQRAPGNIKIHCSDEEHNWERQEDQTKKLETCRKLTGSITTDKDDVRSRNWNIEIADYQFGCPVFKEFLYEVSLTFDSSCTEITQFQGNLKQFCKIKIDQELDENPSLQVKTATGRSAKSCHIKYNPKSLKLR